MAHTDRRCDCSLYNSRGYSHRVHLFLPCKAFSISEMLLNAVFAPELAEDFLLALIPQFRPEAIAVGKNAGATRMAAPFDCG
jgi:hypothetical protein